MSVSIQSRGAETEGDRRKLFTPVPPFSQDVNLSAKKKTLEKKKKKSRVRLAVIFKLSLFFLSFFLLLLLFCFLFFNTNGLKEVQFDTMTLPGPLRD